jgi:hypothetical protein
LMVGAWLGVVADRWGFAVPFRSVAGGHPCWVELSVPDVVAAAAFYGAVFGWEFRDTGAEQGVRSTKSTARLAQGQAFCLSDR